MDNRNVRNIYCVGRNYSSFAQEMGNKISDTPIIFQKPTHSLEPMNGNEITLSGQYGEVNWPNSSFTSVGTMSPESGRMSWCTKLRSGLILLIGKS